MTIMRTGGLALTYGKTVILAQGTAIGYKGSQRSLIKGVRLVHETSTLWRLIDRVTSETRHGVKEKYPRKN